MVTKEPEDLRPLAAAVEYVMTVDPPLKEYSKTSPAHFVRIIERMVEYNEKQLQLARIEAKIEVCDKYLGYRAASDTEAEAIQWLDNQRDELTAQKARLTTKGGDHDT